MRSSKQSQVMGCRVLQMGMIMLMKYILSMKTQMKMVCGIMASMKAINSHFPTIRALRPWIPTPPRHRLRAGGRSAREPY